MAERQMTHYVGDGCDAAHGSPPCMAPDPLRRTCGIPRAIHEDVFRDLKGTRFYHEFQSASASPHQDGERGAG